MEKKKKILLIDDDPDVSSVIIDILENFGYSVLSVNNANKVKDILKNHTFDLIITDLIMPGKVGAEIVSDIREIELKAPILVMTGGGRLELNDNLKEAMKKGANDTLNKPFNFPDLIEKVRNLLSDSDS
jgi:DNA-binding NtrC family response regulator